MLFGIEKLPSIIDVSKLQNETNTVYNCIHNFPIG